MLGGPGAPFWAGPRRSWEGRELVPTVDRGSRAALVALLLLTHKLRFAMYVRAPQIGQDAGAADTRGAGAGSRASPASSPTPLRVQLHHPQAASPSV